ncbi:hypothetical protein Ddc_17621 [Ditylenchus destructor]|nr:hypothetical protein Ddc_17621 [Ditylenchus destructor]
MLIVVREIIPVEACVSSFDLEEDMLSILYALPDPDNEKVHGLESKASKVLKCLNVSAERIAEILAANETLLRLQNEYDNKTKEFNSSQLIYDRAKAQRVDAEVDRNRALISLLQVKIMSIRCDCPSKLEQSIPCKHQVFLGFQTPKMRRESMPAPSLKIDHHKKENDLFLLRPSLQEGQKGLYKPISGFRPPTSQIAQRCGRWVLAYFIRIREGRGKLQDRKHKNLEASMCNWSVERLEASKRKVGTYGYLRGLFWSAKKREKTAEDNFDRAKMDMDFTETVLKESMSDFLCTNQVHDCCTKSYQMYED